VAGSLIKKNSIFQRFEISQVLRPANGAFILNQSVSAENKNRNAIEFSSHLGCESFLTRHASDASQQIDSIGRTAELNHLFGFSEVRFLKGSIREAELI
jgi:hypothetical protein